MGKGKNPFDSGKVLIVSIDGWSGKRKKPSLEYNVFIFSHFSWCPASERASRQGGTQAARRGVDLVCPKILLHILQYYRRSYNLPRQAPSSPPRYGESLPCARRDFCLKCAGGFDRRPSISTCFWDCCFFSFISLYIHTSAYVP